VSRPRGGARGTDVGSLTLCFGDACWTLPSGATATEVGLLGISATQASQAMVFPALFTAGMAMVDTVDSVLMVGAYGWAFVNPLRKLWYNLTITTVSVLVALLIGGEWPWGEQNGVLLPGCPIPSHSGVLPSRHFP